MMSAKSNTPIQRAKNPDFGIMAEACVGRATHERWKSASKMTNASAPLD